MEYEDRITIWAPEGLQLDYALAGLGSRFIAAAFDAALRVIVVAAAVGVAAAAGAGSTFLLIVLIVGSFLSLFVYNIAFEVWGGGRTPGKRWSGLRVLMADGQPVSFAASAIRNLLRIIDEWATALLAGSISILVTKRNQRLGDLAAGTIVVRERRATSGAAAPEALHNLRPGIDVTAVSSSDLAAIREFLGRRERLTRDSRARVARALVSGIAPKVGGLTPGELSDEQLLETVAAAKAA